MWLYLDECFWVKRFLFFLGLRSLFASEGPDDEATGSFLVTPEFRDTLLGPTKLLGSWFLGFVISGLSNLQGGITFVFRGSSCLSLLEICYSVITLFVPKTIVLVANNNLQLKNVGRKVVTICLSGNVFYDHLLTLSQIICLRNE